MQASRQEKRSAKAGPNEQRENKSLLIFDLDDTLVDTSEVYYRARSCFLQALAEAEIDPVVALRAFEDIEVSHIQEYGFAPERYGRSMRVTYERMAGDLGTVVSREILGRIDECARIIITECPKLIEGAVNLLEWAATRYELCLVTRGISHLQLRKVAETSIAKFFRRTEVVTKKDSHVLRRLMDEEGFAPNCTWVIGDSVKSDVNPGLEAGARCILYLYTHPSYVWEQEYGVVAKGPFYVARTLGEVREILERPTSHATVVAL
jgi:putative hydrolase of the HAD superfamily